MYDSNSYRTLYDGTEIDTPYDKWLRDKIKKEEKEMGQELKKRLDLHLQVDDKVLSGYVIYQGVDVTNCGDVAHGSGKRVRGVLSRNRPQLTAEALFVRGDVKDVDRWLFSHTYNSRADAEEARQDIEVLLDYINSKDWKPGGTVPEKVVFPITEEISICRRSGGDFHVWGVDSDNRESICSSGMRHILGNDFVDRCKVDVTYSAKVIIDAPKEN